MENLQNIPLNTIAGVICTIHSKNLNEEAEAQNLGLIHRNIESALAGYDFGCFAEKWERDQEKNLPTDKYKTKTVDEYLLDIVATVELLYTLTFTNLIILNHKQEILKKFKSKKAYMDTCSSYAYSQVKDALLESYKEDNNVPYLKLHEAQKVIAILSSRLTDRVNFQIFEDLSKWQVNNQTSNATHISDAGDTLLWWGLELNQDFRDAANYYI